MRIVIGPHLMVKIKYVFPRGDTYYWQRRIPKDLADRYPATGPLKINLQTSDPRVIASKVARLNRQHEALWEAMRKDPNLTPQSAREAALAILKQHGLAVRGQPNDELALSMFYDRLDGKRESYANAQPEPEEAYHFGDPSEYLTKAELEAARLLEGAEQFLMSDALEVYLAEHVKRGKPGFEKLETYTRRAFGKLTELLGDKILGEVSRDDAKAFREKLLAVMKTASVKRNINVVKAVFASAIDEKGLNIPNVWDRLKIAGLGEDSEDREPFSPEDMAKMRALCRSKDDDMRWVLSIQGETGTRLAEVVGLGLDDIHIDGEEVPYLDIRPRPWRTLKSPATSTRNVPLVGDALWAAGRVLATAGKGQKYAFPRYINDDQCKADSASATLNKWLQASGIDHTTHELRHTMRDRLRNTGATRDIQDAVGGWGKTEIADTYGLGYALKMLHEALLKTLPAKS
ncbi:MAG: tyrosine-type recombinase/integrase [Dechloromonas sp.]|nr:tyrosine-type recombinase/integrase [Dechloromonas sp.]